MREACSAYFSYPHATGRFCDLPRDHGGQHQFTVPRWISEVPRTGEPEPLNDFTTLDGIQADLIRFMRSKTQDELIEMFSQPHDTPVLLWAS